MQSVLLLSLSLVLGTLSAQENRGPQDGASARPDQSIREQLQAFDAGALSLDGLFQNPTRGWCETVAAYYEAGTNEITIKMKLPISRCLAFIDRPVEAAKVAAEYTRAFPKDVRGWRVLGASEMATESYKEAVEAWAMAAKLGDDQNYVALGFAAIAVDRDDLIRDIVVPHLLVQKDRSIYSESKKIEMRSVLIASAAKLDKEEIFLDALRNVKPSDIASSPDLLNTVKQCWGRFHSPESRQIRRSIEQAIQERASQSNGTNGATREQPLERKNSKSHNEKQNIN